MKEPVAFRIGLATFGILALELALIRWTSGQIRIFAYFNDLVLIGAFLGLGLGMALGPRHPGLHRWTLPMLLLASLPLAFSGPLDLVHMWFPDASIALWGDVAHANQALRDGGRLLVFFGVFASLVAVFVFAGSAVGALFTRAAPLRAYSADLGGSLLGILAFTAATAFDAGPPVWLLLGFAGVIVSTQLARSPSPAAALGSNLLGSVLGGCLEYLSMLTGLRFLALLALALYLGAFGLLLRRPRGLLAAPLGSP